MRTAICMSGQARFLEECFPYIQENLIKPNNSDVFMHVWSYENASDQPHKFGGDGGWINHRIDKNSHKKAIELYSPQDFVIEEAFKIHHPGNAHHLAFQNFKSAIPKEANEAGMTLESYSSKIFSDSFCMWHGIMKSNMLANLYSLKNGFKYDFVVRARFDLKIKSRIELSRFENECVYYCDLGQPPGLVSDWLNFGSQKNMSVYSSAYMQLLHADDFYVKNSQMHSLQFGNEFLSALNLHRHGIPAVPINLSVEIPRL